MTLTPTSIPSQAPVQAITPERREAVKAEFVRRGICISAWARDHGFRRHVVNDLLTGHNKGVRGESHKAAVLLGLKDGVVE